MEDNFRIRVDKAFGALASSSSTTEPPPSSNLSSLWSLTDDEIERNEWNRVNNGPEPETDLFPVKKGFLNSDREKTDVGFRLELEELDDLDDDDEQSSGGSRGTSGQVANPKPDDYNDEEWEIKNSIGLDCTLDNEEEEDQYDKVAVGDDKPGDRLYLKEISDYGIEIDSNNELPVSLKTVARDPRANHMAAKLRLKEDDAAAKKMDSLQVSEQHLPDIVGDRVKANDDGNLKSILKRRDDESDSKLKSEHQLNSKSQKRVRFDPECKDDQDKESDEDINGGMDTDSEDKSLVYPLPPDYPSGIPDYMRNPSRYTRYTFESSTDVDDQSNQQAFMDFLNTLKKSKGTESELDDAPAELPKSLTFIPRRKIGDTEMVDSHTDTKQNEDHADKELLHRKGAPISFAGDNAEESEASAMDEDEPVDKKNSSQRAGRKYRIKERVEVEDSN
ncbi:uncharacterized protein LOC126683057 [Mercurialis annua]|uniref:uncharacterized protein LOC126683057 n=1 Tax=Mercurialis annua TaxID=3986 RepID=UPI00215DDF16|nr:uncharacterized protein LOC126683057 [Mercurialis annua]XP_050234841.1 uncharacterized protein LOC126683057 [Mercurialis annua]